MEKNLELRVSELEKMLFLSKNVLSFDEASKFLNLSKSYLYKLTSGNLIPHYKPQGKMLYFEKAELVGEKTYGKGVMQITTEMENGGAVVLTVAEYRTTVSECYDKIGLSPDYTVVDDNADDDYDVQYYEAMNIINRALAD